MSQDRVSTLRGRRVRGLTAATVGALAIGLAAPGAASAVVDRVGGNVTAGGAPLRGATVTLYAAPERGTARVLASTTTNRRGQFRLRYRIPAGGETVRYLMTNGGTARATQLPRNHALAAVLGTGTGPNPVVVNELTTVGSAYSTAQFVRGRTIAGPAPGMPRAADMTAHLANVRTGQLGFSTIAYATDIKTTPRTIRALSNMLAACATDTASCQRLIRLAQPRGERRPANTFEAIATIADNPSNSVKQLFTLSRTGPRPFKPALSNAPEAWTVALRLMGQRNVLPNGSVIGGQLNGPGLVAFDAEGDAWIANNYEYDANPLNVVCAGDAVFELDPTVTGPRVLTDSLRTYQADQLWGAGFGVAVDPKQQVWVGNFGFTGQGFGPRSNEQCTERQTPPPNVSVSLFSPEGVPISPSVAKNPPSGGFTDGDIKGPQGMLSDRRGNVWIASCGNRSVVRYPADDPHWAQNIAPEGLREPFGLWLDADGNAWVTSNQTSQVYAFRPDGSQLPGSPYGNEDTLLRSMGINVDSQGNKWVANSFWVSAPCADFKPGALTPPQPGGSLTLLQTDGPRSNLTRFTSPSLRNPWGVAIDGEDHVFVANFGGRRLAEFCGVQLDTCPAGSRSVGSAIGKKGYPYNGLDRNTGVSIDNSGHVWLANNWIEIPVQTNPGGKSVVVYFGLAEPVETPSFGPPVPVLKR